MYTARFRPHPKALLSACPLGLGPEAKRQRMTHPGPPHLGRAMTELGGLDEVEPEARNGAAGKWLPQAFYHVSRPLL
jgi:hypothetical protein